MKGLLVLTRTFGDVVLANVLIKNIKLKYPSMGLDYIVEENYLPLVEDNPLINKIIPIKSTSEDWDKVLTIMSSGYYDEVFFAQQVNAYDNCWHQLPMYNRQHLVDFYAERCGIPLVERHLLAYVVSNSGNATKEDNVIAIHNKTLAPVKDWSHFAELTKMLLAAGYKVVQLGKGDEPDIDGAVKLSMNLRQIMEYFALGKCKLFVGLDSGLSYLAAAFNITVVSIYGATLPSTNGAYGSTVHNIVAEQDEKCKVERKNVRCHGILGGNCMVKARCIDTVQAVTVFNKIMEVFKNGKNDSK